MTTIVAIRIKGIYSCSGMCRHDLKFEAAGGSVVRYYLLRRASNGCKYGMSLRIEKQAPVATHI